MTAIQPIEKPVTVGLVGSTALLARIDFQPIETMPWNKLVFVTDSQKVSWCYRRYSGGHYKMDGGPDNEGPDESFCFPASACGASGMIRYENVKGWAPFTREQAATLGWEPNPYYSEG